MIEIVCVWIVDLPVYLIDCRVKNMNTYQTMLVYIVLIFFLLFHLYCMYIQFHCCIICIVTAKRKYDMYA